MPDIPHTCERPVPFYYSDRENFGNEYVNKRTQKMSPNEAFSQTLEEFETGLGTDFDALCFGTKVGARRGSFSNRKN